MTGVASVGIATTKCLGSSGLPDFEIDWLIAPEKYESEWFLWAKLAGLHATTIKQILGIVRR